MITSTKTQDNNMEKYFYRSSVAVFKKIPGMPVAYWTGKKTLNSFESNFNLGKLAPIKQGLATANNDLFLRLWHEPSLSSIGFNISSINDSRQSLKKWFPYNKGGDWRKWYGNCDYMVNWEDDGRLIRNFKDQYGNVRSRPQNTKYYFQEGITWGDITTKSFAARFTPQGFIFDVKGSSGFPSQKNLLRIIALMNSKLMFGFMQILNPTSTFQVGDISRIPLISLCDNETTVNKNSSRLIFLARQNWDSYETSWDFTTLPLLHSDYGYKLSGSYAQLRAQWQENTQEMQRLEEENNRIFIDAYGLQDELTPEVPLNEITLTCNPHYRYRLGRQWDEASEEERNAELERQLQSDTLCELISYAIGCMMGRYSIDQPGLILASQGETLQDYLERVPNPRFLPDDDAIVPLTVQEWFADDATHRVREFVRTVWGEQHLQENLDFIAESLCLSAIRPRKGESSLDCIRRYLSTQFYKDHMRTYKKRPIYWLFSSGKLKAFECLVYLHRYTEGTLARMRTEYVIPLTARLHSHGERLEEARANSTSAAETKRLEKELDQLHKQQAELAEFDEQLRHYADQRIRLDLDDGVKVNYGKFGNLLADVKAIVG